MFTLKMHVTPEIIEAIKAELTRAVPEIKSSHRCEAIGRGLGFGTYAALKAAAQSPHPALVDVSGEPFVGYLASHRFETTGRQFYHAATKAVLRKIVEQTPTLTMWGMGIGRPQRQSDGKFENAREHSARFVEAREELQSDAAVAPFLLSLAMLQRVKRTKTIRIGTGSYWLKHIAENYTCTYPDGDELGPQYVPNGAFVAAAIHAGFHFKRHVDQYGYDEPSVSFNMSTQSLVDLDCEIRPNGARAQDRKSKEEMRFNRKHQIWPH
ncbi:hypothetical protein [Mesorhizobium sp. M0684]|uniref:hypothetical protein n=1 Tax=unclassified Mesorhizobium TaxID=325217 RepID=UPI003334BFD3